MINRLVCEVFIKSNRNIDDLAILLSKSINISNENITPYQKHQKRYSDNKGGDYYLFEFFGLLCELIKNKGDAFIEERKEYSFYIIVSTELNVSFEIFKSVIQFMQQILFENKIESIIEF